MENQEVGKEGGEMNSARLVILREQIIEAREKTGFGYKHPSYSSADYFYHVRFLPDREGWKSLTIDERFQQEDTVVWTSKINVRLDPKLDPKICFETSAFFADCLQSNPALLLDMSLVFSISEWKKWELYYQVHNPEHFIEFALEHYQGKGFVTVEGRKIGEIACQGGIVS